MARPSKYNWDEIQKAYECGMAIPNIVKKYSVTKKTLENKISEKKWLISGEVKSVIEKRISQKTKWFIKDKININRILSGKL